MTITSYVVAQKAFAKIAFHTAKYPHRQVNGVLVGKEEMGTVEISDAVPLLHHWTSLSPSMEIGLDLTRNYAVSLGLDVVGYYQASEQANDTTLGPVGEKVVELIRKIFPNATAFVVDSSKLATGEPALVPYLPQGSSAVWRPSNDGAFTETSGFRLSPPDATSTVLRLIHDSHLHRKLGDFDDHLEDVSIDWLRNGESVFLVLLCFVPTGLSADWWTVEWDATEFTSFSGNMIVPDTPDAGGTPYVWPGLQPGSTGVLQAVLDGRTGTWWIGDGYYGTPSLPWGNGFNAYPGQTVHFTFSVDSSGTWTCTLSGPSTAQSTFALSGLTMNRAILAVELYDVAFNFGPVIYQNITLTATTAASSWCSRTSSLGYTSGGYTVSGAVASGNTCSVSEVIMPSAS
ncbi:hypothetical protein ACEPAH_9382 [Sanghuangporus vaninii]